MITRLVAISAIFWASFAPVSAAPNDSQIDATAIAKFLSIGFANTPTNFSSIRGTARPTLGGIEQYAALTWPDHTHFRDCKIGHFGPTADLRETHTYECVSTARRLPKEKLFELARREIRIVLPVSYAGDAPQNFAETWTRRGHPDVHLYVYSQDDGQHYLVRLSKEL
jgi:hypothetical protein